jgi:hypothetical protein
MKIKHIVTISIFLLVESNRILGEGISKLTQVFDPEMINADIAYFEHITGPARNTYDNKKIYKVDGCEVTAHILKGTIRSLRMEVSPQCTFDLNNFFPNSSSKLPPPHKMTFGNFFSSLSGDDKEIDISSDHTTWPAKFYVDCLGSCGNAADPFVYAYTAGKQEALLEVYLVDELASKALEKWEEAMRKEIGDAMTYANIPNCSFKYDEAAYAAFHEVKISAITVGTDIVSKDGAYDFTSECKQ